MKLLVVDQDGVGLSLCYRASLAGHQVRWYIDKRPGNNPKTGDGFKGIEKVDNFVPHLMWADLIISTSNDKYISKLDWARQQGARVFGPTPQSARLEIDRGYGMKMMESVGIELAPYETFANVREAKKHVLKTGARFVFKALGSNPDKATTYVSKNAADLVGWIERIDARGQAPEGEIMLQQFIKGIELGVSRFMGKKGFIGQWNESFEHKKLMPGNYGPNTGEMGTIAYFTQESKLGAQTLGKLEGKLIELGHTGDIAIGFMIPTEGPKAGVPLPTEFTCRFGWPITNLMLGATEGDPVEWMRDALDGKDTTSFRESIGCCLVLTHGDFPHGNKTKKEVSDVPLQGITKGNKAHIHPQSIKIDVLPDMEGEKVVRRPMWNTSGDYIAVVTGFGADVKMAAERAYKTVKQLNVSDMIVRDDVGEGMKDQLPRLHKLGYATHCEYELKKD